MTDGTRRLNKKVVVYAISALILTFVAIVMRTLSLTLFFDSGIGYYTHDVLPYATNIFCVLCVVLFLSALFTVRTSDVTSDGREHNAFLAVAGIVAVAGFAVYFFISISGYGKIEDINSVIGLVGKLCVIAAALYFAMNVSSAQSNKSAQVMCGYGIIIWLVYALAVTYFDNDVQMNSPDKLTLHLALVASMIFFVCEFRAYLAQIRKGIYLSSLCAAVFFTGFVAVPDVIAQIMRAHGNYTYIRFDYVCLGIFIYCAVRLISFAFCIHSSKLVTATTTDDSEDGEGSAASINEGGSESSETSETSEVSGNREECVSDDSAEATWEKSNNAAVMDGAEDAPDDGGSTNENLSAADNGDGKGTL